MNFNEKTNVGVVLQNVHKVYKVESTKVQALSHINLQISQGTIASVIGRSGSGKSTLLHVIGTLDKPSKGKILLNGQDISEFSDKTTSAFRNCTIGFVFQMNNLLPEFSAIENVMLPGLISGAKKKIVKARAADVLNLVGLSHREKHRPGELSGGEQQRVAIARALFMAPPLLLADEPTGNLDKKTSLIIQDLLMQLCHDHNMTMLLVTHDVELSKKMPEQIVMEDGRIISRGTL